MNVFSIPSVRAHQPFLCVAGILFSLLTARSSVAQGLLHSGETGLGNIAVSGEVDGWTFEAKAGDSIVIRAGEVSVNPDLRPKLEVISPKTVLVTSGQAFDDVEVSFRAADTGTYTVNVSATFPGGTGTYRIHVAAISEPVVISSGEPGGPIAMGETQRAPLKSGDLQLWTFSASAGDNIIVRAGEISANIDLRPQLRLYGPNGALLDNGQGFDDAEVTFRATNSGTFTILVSAAFAGGSGEYLLNFATSQGTPVVSAGDEGGSITNGELVTGTLNVGELDIWTFTAKAGENVIVRAGEVSVNVDLRPQLRVYGPTGTLIVAGQAFDDVEVSFRATNDGVYTIVVNPVYPGGSGTYRLALALPSEPLVISPGDEGGPILNGEVKEGSLSMGDLDLWTFTAHPGENIIVKAGEISVNPDLRPLLRIYGPTGILVGTDQGFDDAEASLVATNDGLYTTVVSAAYAGGSGTYRITLAHPPEAVTVSPGDEGGAIANGDLKVGALSVGDLDLWTFTAQPGENIIVKAGEISADPDLRPLIRLYGPAGNFIATSQGFDDAELSARATNGGVYTIVVSAIYAGGSGTYRLALALPSEPLNVPAGDEGGPIANGELKDGALSVGDLDLWTFSAKAGESIVIRAGENTVSPDLRPLLRLYGPTGTLLASGQGFDDTEITARATNTGVFTIVVSASYAGGSGTYRLALGEASEPVVVSPGDEGGTIQNGESKEGTLSVGDLDVWTFDGLAGENLILRVAEKSVNVDLRPQLRLYGPDGALVLGNQGFDGVELTTLLTNSGRYIVLVNPFYAGGSGVYRLHMLRVPGPFVVNTNDEGGFLAVGASPEGLLEYADLDPWVFTGCAGELLSISADAIGDNNTLALQLRLYGRDGALLASKAGKTNVSVQARAPFNGAYTVVVTDASAGGLGRGNYRLNTHGFYSGVRICGPFRSGNLLSFFAAGGTPGVSYVVVTAPDIATPQNLWNPVLTNTFVEFGTTDFTQLVKPGVNLEFFRLRMNP